MLNERVTAFAQFAPKNGMGFPVDLMIVDEATFEKMRQASDLRNYAGRQIRVVGVLHLIALKLHSPERGLADKDFFDIVSLIHANSIDIEGPDFREILKSHGTASIQARLDREFRSL